MPLLRRTHDRHRGVRTVEAAARAAGRNGNEPGELPHDPAWHGPAFSRRHSASGNGPTRVHGDHRRRQGRVQPRAGPTTPRGGTTKRSVRIHPGASRRRSRHRRHQPQIEIPIAIDCGPRVPSSGTFVRLPAPETLHESRPSASASGTPRADNAFRCRANVGAVANIQKIGVEIYPADHLPACIADTARARRPTP